MFDQYNLPITVSFFPILVSIVLRVITAFFFLALVIPLQLKEAGVKNGLRRLRKQMVAIGMILFWVNTSGLVLIVLKATVPGNVFQNLTDAFAIINSFCFFAVGYLLYQIYHQNYSPANKELHEKFEKEEKKVFNQSKEKK